MQTLYGMMSLQRQIGAMGDDAEERRRRKEGERRDDMVREAARRTQGNPEAMAREVGLIDPERGLTLQTAFNEETRRKDDQAAQVKQRKQQEFDQMVQRIDAHKTIYGKAPQIIHEIQANPERYGELLPTLRAMAGEIDPSLADLGS